MSVVRESPHLFSEVNLLRQTRSYYLSLENLEMAVHKTEFFINMPDVFKVKIDNIKNPAPTREIKNRIFVGKEETFEILE